MAAAALVAPLLVLLIFSFFVPIADVMRRAVLDDEIESALPKSAAMLRLWDRESDPTDAMFTVLGREIQLSARARTLTGAARRLNFALENGRSLVMDTGAKLASMEAEPASWREVLLDADAQWGQQKTWVALAHAAGPTTDFYLLTALDLERGTGDHIVFRPPPQSLFMAVLQRTFAISASVTVLCLILGFPLAFFIANAQRRTSDLLMISVLLPLWTSVLVRTAAWTVLLQDNGLVNWIIQGLGISSGPWPLLFHRPGVVIAMMHVQLPFMVLPLVATMKSIPRSYMRAAVSLGAHPAIAFLRVYLPMTLPGIAAGVLLVFIMCLGYYVTPALIGGPSDQMLSYFIAFYASQSANWGLAAALGVLLLTATAILYAVYSRLMGAGQGRFA